MGHVLVMRGDYSSTRMGAGQAVMRNYTTGINAGASDPRKDGAAVSALLPIPAATGAASRAAGKR
jgi:gamma-glutamyltranspeptidase/glutathione hydrolase